MLDCVLLVVFFGLALEGFGNGDDSVDVVLADLEVALLEVFVPDVGPALVVLEPPLVLLLRVVIGHMDAGEDELRVVLQILRDVMQFVAFHCLYLILHDVFLQRTVLNNLLDDLLELSFVDHARDGFVDVLAVRQHVNRCLGDHLSNASDLLEVELDVLEGNLNLLGQLLDRLLDV